MLIIQNSAQIYTIPRAMPNFSDALYGQIPPSSVKRVKKICQNSHSFQIKS